MNKREIFLCGNSENLNKEVFKKLKLNKDIIITISNEFKIEDLLFNNYYKVIFVVDSFYIEKNLNLIIKMLEINNNLILCIKNNDKVKININKLSSLLKINIIDIKKLNILYELIDIKNFEKNNLEYKLIENNINNISNLLPSINNKNYISIKLLEGDKNIVNLVKEKLNIDILTTELNDYLRDINFEEIKEKRYIKINEICNNIVKETIEYKEINNINKILSSKIFGMLITIFFSLLIIILTLILYKIITIPFLNNKLLLNNNLLLSGIKSIYLSIIITFIPTILILLFYELIEESGILSLITFHLDKMFSKFKSSGKIYKLYLDKYLLNEPSNINLFNKEEKNIFILSSVYYPSLNKFILIIFFANIFFPNIKFLTLLFILTLVFLTLIFISLILSKIIPTCKYKKDLVSFNIEIPKLKFPIINIKDKIKIIFIKKIKYIFLIGMILYLLSNLNLNVYEFIIISYILSLLLNESVLLIAIIFYFNINNIDFEILKSILIYNEWNIKIVLSTLILFIFNLPNIYNLKIIKDETYFKYKWLIIISPLIISIFIILLLFI